MSNTNSTLSIQPWERLWLPDTSWDLHPRIDEDLLTEFGYANSSDLPFGDPLSGIGTLRSFSHHSFLLLLGRPGAGKSQEMEAAHAGNWLGRSILIRGKEISNERPGPLIEEQLETAFPVPEEHLGLRIIIDGLDEARLQNKNFIPQLTQWMRLKKGEDGLPIYRLAISCRWADWSEAEVAGLAALWGNHEPKKLVLCPLKKPDAITTLNDRYGEALTEQFWKLLAERQLEPVACWPQGFKALLTGFEASLHKSLPQSLGAAIADQIKKHCMLADTPDDSVRWEISVHDAEWRQRVAGRLAAAMIWSGKPTLSIALHSQHNETSVNISDLDQTEEVWQNGLRKVTLADLTELVSRAGLLKRVSTNWVFQSQVYQEWLAADWLQTQQLGEAKLRSLFGASGQNGWRVFPALKSVAAWLARMDSTFRSLILIEDPLVLLRLDAESLPTKDKKDIIEAILGATERIRVVDSAIWQSHLHSLVHDELSQQLRRWLEDENTHTTTKIVAVEIAEKTKQTGLVPFLWNLYPTTKGRLQSEIASALHHLAKDPASINKWKAVLAREIPNDGDATLLGSALEFLVTEEKCVPVRDVLDWVIPKINFRVIGLYDLVIGQLQDFITVEDLPAVFAQLAKHPRNYQPYESQEPARNFNQKALRLAFQHFDRPEVAEALVNYWHACLKYHVHPHHDLNASWTPAGIGLENDAKRKEIIQALIHHPQFERTSQRKWVWAGEYLFTESDFEWCLDQILTAPSTEGEWRYALVVSHYLRRTDLSGHIGEKFEHAWEKSEFLRQLLPPLHEGKNILQTLVEEIAIQQSQRDIQISKDNARRTKREFIFQERIKKLTKSCKEGHDQGKIVWPGILTVLAARHHGDGQHMVTFGPEDHVHEDESWMRDAAKRYLLSPSPPLEYNDGLTALFALGVCSDELNQTGPVAEALMTYWLVPLLDVMSGSSLEKASAGLTRLNFAALFPEASARAFGEIMRKHYSDMGSMGKLLAFQDFWSSGMTRQLTAILKTEPIQPSGFATALQCLFKNSKTDAIDIAEYWLSHFSDVEDATAKAALVGASAVMLEGNLAPQVKPHLTDPAFVAVALKNAIGSLSYKETRIDVTGWSNTALQDLANATWLAFPKMKKHFSGARWVSSNELTSDFRDHITNACHSRGLIVNIPSTHSEDNPEEEEQRKSTVAWNAHAIQEAQAGATWQFITPSAFFELAKKPNARFARNQDELMEATIESLKRWEHELTHNDAWNEIWDIQNPARRHEEDIAKKIRTWLKRDLAIVTVEREIELSSDERVDILVQTQSLKETPLSLAIELKLVRPRNNKERHSAMESQLLSYLKQRINEGWTHGLYVVLWTPDPTKGNDTLEAMNSEMELLKAQAEKLSKAPFLLRSLVLDARYGGSVSKPRKGKQSSTKKK